MSILDFICERGAPLMFCAAGYLLLCYIAVTLWREYREEN